MIRNKEARGDSSIATTSDSDDAHLDVVRPRSGHESRLERAELAALAAAANAMADESLPYLSTELASLARRAVELERGPIEDSTRRTYRYAVRHYENFADANQLDPFAPITVRLYVSRNVDEKTPKNTLYTRLAAIRDLAHNAGKPDPTQDPHVIAMMPAALRKLQGEPRRVTPATFEVLPRLVEAASVHASQARLNERLRHFLALRDRSLILFGFALGRRGAELAALEISDLDRRAGGIIVRIRRSKINQAGEPEYVGVPAFSGNPYCPVATLDSWLDAAGIAEGRLYRTLSPIGDRSLRPLNGRDISRRLEVIAEAAGLPGIWRSHSLRRGVVTSAEARGVARSRTRTLTGWKSDAMFSVYADHEDKIAASPLNDIYPTREN